MNMQLTDNITVKEIVVNFPQTRAMLETLGIDYCCGGKIPLAQAAENVGLSTDQVLSNLHQVLESEESNTTTAQDWNLTSLTELADHIEQTHHVFMKTQLPRLAGLLDKTLQAHGEKHGDMLRGLQHSLLSLKSDIEMHLAKEEQILFPLIRQMEAFHAGQGPTPEMHCGTIGNPIRQMEHEHDAAGQFLVQMRQVSDDYTLPDDACPTFTALFEGLEAMEKDLHEHIHLENNILFPKAQILEEQL